MAERMIVRSHVQRGDHHDRDHDHLAEDHRQHGNLRRGLAHNDPHRPRVCGDGATSRKVLGDLAPDLARIGAQPNEDDSRCQQQHDQAHGVGPGQRIKPSPQPKSAGGRNQQRSCNRPDRTADHNVRNGAPTLMRRMDLGRGEAPQPERGVRQTHQPHSGQERQHAAANDGGKSHT